VPCPCLIRAVVSCQTDGLRHAQRQRIQAISSTGYLCEVTASMATDS
jgi:hypothetical protein